MLINMCYYVLIKQTNEVLEHGHPHRSFVLFQELSPIMLMLIINNTSIPSKSSVIFTWHPRRDLKMKDNMAKTNVSDNPVALSRQSSSASEASGNLSKNCFPIITWHVAHPIPPSQAPKTIKE